MFAKQMRAPEASAEQTFRVKLLEDPEQLAAWARQWRSLEDSGRGSGGIFQSYDWLRPMMALPDRQAVVLAVEDEQGPALVAPFCVASFGGLRVLEWLGEPMLAYGDLLARADVDVAGGFAAALAFLRRSGKRLDAVHLRKLREDALILPLLQKMGLPVASGTAPFVDLSAFADFDAFLASRNKRSIKGYRRRRRRLEEEGEVRFLLHRAGPEAQALGRETLALKLEWMKVQGRISRTFSSSERLEALIAGLGEPATGACVSGLFLKDRPLALEIGFLRNDRYFSFIGAIDLDFAAYSPGNLQIMDTLRWCFQQGVRTFDFLPPDSDYKRSWATGSLGLGDCCFALTPAGRLYSGLYVKSLYPLLVRAQAGAPSVLRGLSSFWLTRQGEKPSAGTSGG